MALFIGYECCLSIKRRKTIYWIINLLSSPYWKDYVGQKSSHFWSSAVFNFPPVLHHILYFAKLRAKIKLGSYSFLWYNSHICCSLTLSFLLPVEMKLHPVSNVTLHEPFTAVLIFSIAITKSDIRYILTQHVLADTYNHHISYLIITVASLMGPILLLPCHPKLLWWLPSRCYWLLLQEVISPRLWWVTTPFRVIGSFLLPCLHFYMEQICPSSHCWYCMHNSAFVCP